MFKDSLIYITFNFLQKAFSFLLLPVFTYFLTKDGVGKITLLNTLIPIISIFCDLALYGAGNVYTFKLKNKLEINQLWGNIYMFTNVFGLLLVSSLFLYGRFNRFLLFQGLSKVDSLLLLLIVFFNTIYSQHQTYLQAHKQVKDFTRNGLIFTLLNLSLVVINIIALHLGYIGYFYALLITNGIFYLYATFFAFANYTFKPNVNLLIKCLKYSIPLLPHLTFGMFLAYIDRVFVNRYLGTSELGIYGISCQFAMVFSLLLNGFSSAYSSHGLENLENGNYEKMIQYGYTCLIIFSLLVLSVSLASFDLFWIFIRHDYISGWVVLPIFAVAYMFQLGYLFFSIIVFYRKSLLINAVTLIAGGLNVILNMYLTKLYGIEGATFSTVISYLVSMLIAYYLSKQLLNVGFSLLKIIMYQLSTIILILPVYLINHTTNNLFYLNSLINFLYFIVGAAILLFTAKNLFGFSIFQVKMAKVVG